MDQLFQSLFGNIPHELLQVVTGDGVARAAVFLLVATRWTGFFLAWPLIERGILPWPIRIGLVVLLTLIVAPGIGLAPDDGRSIRAVSHLERVEIRPLDQTALSTIDADWSSTDLVAGMICNAAVGVSLALSIAIFLSGLKLAGEWIDRHSGLGMGQVLNPDFSSGDSGTGKLVCLFGIAVILTMLPMNGHLHLVRLILDTFHVIPVGLTRLPNSISELLIAMTQQSLILGLRIAVPFVVAMSLLDLTLSWIRRSSRWELASIAFVLRAAASMLVLAATLPGIQEAVMSSVQETIEIAASKIDSPSAQD
ncbi:MAG: type secretion system inner rane protein [Schlesneria sp.]|nr:type secretion system inner rane protein [Schlesneria sp.]